MGESELSKATCGACGYQMEYSPEYEGGTMRCPQCQKDFPLRRPPMQSHTMQPRGECLPYPKLPSNSKSPWLDLPVEEEKQAMMNKAGEASGHQRRLYRAPRYVPPHSRTNVAGVVLATIGGLVIACVGGFGLNWWENRPHKSAADPNFPRPSLMDNARSLATGRPLYAISVENYIRVHANDPGSVQIVSMGPEVEDSTPGSKVKYVTCTFRAKNGFGGLVLGTWRFTVMAETHEVVYAEEMP